MWPHLFAATTLLLLTSVAVHAAADPFLMLAPIPTLRPAQPPPVATVPLPTLRSAPHRNEVPQTLPDQDLSVAPIVMPTLRPDLGIPPPPPTPPFNPVQTRQMCNTALDEHVANFEPIRPIVEENGCGDINPVLLKSTGDPATKITVMATTNCAMVGALAAWTEDVVQSAALTYLGEEIIAFRNASSYVCRARNNRPGAKMSEHAFANALDISAFKTVSGGWIAVAGNWNIASPESHFLKAIHREACAYFTTVLGPNANAAHHDHLHLDLGKHGRSGTYRICE